MAGGVCGSQGKNQRRTRKSVHIESRLEQVDAEEDNGEVAMEDLIKRQDAIDAINCNIVITGKRNSEVVASTIGTFVDRIKALPSAEPERKTGKWITDTYGHIICSECGWCAPRIMTGCLCDRHLDYVKSEFCWCCGADMRGEQDGNT